MAVALFALRGCHEISLVILSLRPDEAIERVAVQRTAKPESRGVARPLRPHRKRRADRTSKAAIPPPQPEDQIMSTIDEHCRLIREGTFLDATLAELRERLTFEEVERVCVRLKREANAVLEAADALGERNFPRQFPDAIVVDSYFGGCPECGKTDGFLDIGGNHWFVCHAHKKRWSPGSNLFSSWKEETEAQWEANAALLDGYDKTEPLLVGRWPRDPEARAQARAEWDFDRAWAERNRRVGNDPQCCIATAGRAERPVDPGRDGVGHTSEGRPGA
jgi:hypothetical protein